MADIIKSYQSGLSIPQISDKFGIPLSTIRSRLARAGVLRTRKDALTIASKQGRLGAGLRGKKRTFSAAHKCNISKSRREWSKDNAVGVSLKPNGYLEYTTGPNKGRSVHVVTMEERIGRNLRKDECVHHIDEVKTNNDQNNLALMTRSGHARHHRLTQIKKEMTCRAQ